MYKVSGEAVPFLGGHFVYGFHVVPDQESKSAARRNGSVAIDVRATPGSILVGPSACRSLKKSLTPNVTALVSIRM